MFAEYIWLDGALPTQQLRSKARYLPIKGAEKIKLENLLELPILMPMSKK